MLTTLKIKNLALVDDLTWEPGSGLVCVTGETGAGKSMIVGALKLILGERANHDLIRRGETHCTVEAVFQLSNQDQVNQLLEDAGLDTCDGDSLVLKRSFSKNGNKQFINCCASTLSVLKSLGDLLIDLHGPHDHQSLLSRERQLAMLDEYSQLGQAAQTYRQTWREWQQALSNYQNLRDADRASEQELDLLRFQVDEINTAQLDVQEALDLDARYKLANNSSRLLEAAQVAGSQLKQTILPALSEVRRALRDLEQLDSSALELTSGYDSAHIELEELQQALLGYVENLDNDPESLRAMEQRIDLLETLRRKYGHNIEDVIAHGQKAAAKLASIDHRGDELQSLQTLAAKLEKKVSKQGQSLSKKRRNSAPLLAREISRHLKDLGFKQSQFEIQLEPVHSPELRGLEQADFVFAPNPGEPPKPLRVIASSGEMSRVMLAVKSALAEQDQIPLMVFDEIDANVGGEIAHAVGAKMASLGAAHQVIAITHLPPVAASAHCHYLVRKEFSKNSTRSTLNQVTADDRVAELARMLGGGSDSALAHAQTLLADKKN
ncbi:MAG: DNA repair protein RecN [Verrucomicrobiales bacterium]|nr:DNA repair protein RecN [Verrucomicrobiales bacterium]